MTNISHEQMKMAIDEEIKQYKQLIKNNEIYINCNDKYNFSQLRWKKENCKYRQIIELLKDCRKLLHTIDDVKEEVKSI